MLRKKRLVLEILLWSGLVLGVYFFSQWRGAATAQVQRLPPLLVTSLGGEPQVLTPHPGQAMLVNFWSPDCPPCLAETPALVALDKIFAGPHLRVVGIATAGSSAEGVHDVARRFAIPYPLYLDREGEASRSVGGVLLTPTTLLVNGHGEIVGRFVGAISLPVIFWRLLWLG
ncbi:TlpA family protein disulfide reductase [Acidithiobacillus caldus]